MKIQDKKKKEFGGGLVEYGLLVGLIAMIAITSVRSIGGTLAGANPDAEVNFDQITKQIDGSGGVQ